MLMGFSRYFPDPEMRSELKNLETEEGLLGEPLSRVVGPLPNGLNGS